MTCSTLTMTRRDEMKRCTKCGKEYPATTEHFHRRAEAKDGLRAECKACNCERVRRRYEADPERAREQSRRYREANHDKVREQDRRYREANAERRREYQRRYNEANPEKVKEKDRRHRARKAGAGGTHTAEDIRTIYDSQKGRCWYCLKPLNGTYHVDHRIPLARGGSNAPENIVIACPTCNLSKGARLPQEWNGRLL